MYISSFIYNLILGISIASANSSDLVSNPKAYVQSHAEFPEDGFIEFDCNSCSAMKNSVFIAAKRECGNSICNFYLFERTGHGGKYSFISKIGINSHGFQFLKSYHNHQPDILSYNHQSAEEGLLQTLIFDGKEYRSDIKTDKIKSSEVGLYIKAEPIKEKEYSKVLKEIGQ